MSTRARIALALPNGKYRSVYLHRDGYPEGAGDVLLQHYDNPGKVRSLIALGDLSRLSPLLAPSGEQAHDFDHPLLGVTVAYRRDRGDKGTGAQNSVNAIAFMALAQQCNAEFVYVHSAGKWFFAPVKKQACVDIQFERLLADSGSGIHSR